MCNGCVSYEKRRVTIANFYILLFYHLRGGRGKYLLMYEQNFAAFY